MELRLARVALADVIEHAVETAQPVIDAAGHKLRQMLPSEPVFLNADLARLAQVVANLLTNSAKYTGHSGEISLIAQRHGDELILAVRDTGIGIPADALPHVFDMFSQVDRNLEQSTSGLGIGLALVKGLVEMHSGSVGAESDGPGEGSCFTIRLPVFRENRVSDPCSASNAPPLPLRLGDQPIPKTLSPDDAAVSVKRETPSTPPGDLPETPMPRKPISPFPAHLEPAPRPAPVRYPAPRGDGSTGWRAGTKGV
jgi:two-component sensor histidine kinase